MTKNSYLLRKLLYNKKFTIPISICFAVVFWLIITVQENPVRERTLTTTVNIKTEDTVLSDLGLDVVSGGYNQSVDVVVQGPSYIVSSLTAADISVQPVLLPVSAAGNYDLELIASPNSSVTGYSVVKVNPSTISVTFDFLETKTFTVNATAKNVVAATGLVAETAVVSKNEDKIVTIKGVRSDIEKIFSVSAVADIKKMLSSTDTFDADIVLYDSEGKELDISKYTLSVEKVKITVPISRKKTVGVEAVFKNVPDYFKDKPLSYTLEQNKVTVIGPPETVDKLEKVQLAEIDFNSISPDADSFDAKIILPDGVKLVDNKETINVKLSLGGYSVKTFRISKFNFINALDGTAASGTAIQNVKICAPYSVLRKLNSNNLYADVDLAKKQAGDYTVSVVIKSKEYGQMWQVGEYTAAVTVK